MPKAAELLSAIYMVVIQFLNHKLYHLYIPHLYSYKNLKNIVSVA